MMPIPRHCINSAAGTRCAARNMTARRAIIRRVQEGCPARRVDRSRRARSRKMSASAVGNLFKEAASEWLNDKAPRLGAALAYYTIFSLAPLLVIVIGIAGLMLG